jgi:hypothetical protein
LRTTHFTGETLREAPVGATPKSGKLWTFHVLLSGSRQWGGDEMSKISVVMQMKGMTKEQYNQVMEDLEIADEKATAAGKSITKGRVLHIATLEQGGMYIFDIWERAEDFAHMGASLIPILQKYDVLTAEPEIRPVHNVVHE